MRERGNINNPAALQGHLTIIGAVGNRPLWMGGLGLRSSKYPLLDVDTHTTDRHQSVHRLGCFISHKTKRCSLFSHFLPQPVRDPHLLRKHRRDSQGRNHPARDSSARPLCNFTRGLGKEVLNPRTYGQNVWTCCQEIWESAGRTPEECTCAHTCTYAHTHHPLFCSFWKELCLPGDWRQQRRPWYSWSSASKRREKRVKGRFEVQPEKRSGEGASGGRSGQGNGPVVGRRECGRERRSWQSQLEKVKNTSGKQLQPDGLRSAERVKLHPNSQCLSPWPNCRAAN